MREILFRGKRKDNGEWVEGDFVHPCNIVFEEIGYDEILKQDNVNIINDYAVIPETVGQFTGKIDRNGKKIFEGDKVALVYSDDDDDDDLIYAVEFYKDRYILRNVHTGFCAPLPAFFSEEMIVVGNVADEENDVAKSPKSGKDVPGEEEREQGKQRR